MVGFPQKILKKHLVVNIFSFQENFKLHESVAYCQSYT